jgi:ADP-heptose:LPS heptosyltransferase
MKVIQILPFMNVGGVERGVLDLAKFFKNTDIETIVISGGGRLIEKLQEANISHYQLPVYKKSVTSLFLIPKIRSILDKENIDIIHGRSRVPGWISFFASRGRKTHFITTAHGLYKSKFWSEVMGWGKFVICPSKVVARYMKDNYKVPEEKIVIINRWVDLDKFKFSAYTLRKESNTLVSMGRISPTKGYEHLIEGFKKIVRFNPLMKLQIVGSPDKSKIKYFDYLKSLVHRFSLTHNVQFIGVRHDVENVLKQAKILIAPSVIEESFGRVLVEAMAMGVPVIATRVGGFTEIIDDGINGILTDPGDSQGIAANILKILNDSDYANKLVINARDKVERLYTMEKCLKETQEVYKKALSFQRILVIKISSLGDLILSFPSLKVLKERFPDSKICLLTLNKYAPLCYDCPYVDEIITIDDNYKRIKNILEISKDLRRKSFDYIIDLQNSRASHLISCLSFPRQSFGYSLRWGALLTKKIKYTREDDPLTSQERLLKLLGVTFKEKKLIFWDRKDEQQILPDENLIGINISASKRWESKNWPSKNILQLLDIIIKNLPNFKVVLIGDPDVKEAGEKIEKFMNNSRLFNLCGKTNLRNLPSAIKKLKVFITPDTATLHLASALGVPTIALFGPTNPQRHRVKSKDLYVFNKQLQCSFCYSPQCKLEEKNLCMKKISAQEVFTKIKEIIENSSMKN